MKRAGVILLSGLTLAAAALLDPAPASAAPIRECGNAGTLYGGAVRVYNVTTRRVGCPSARRRYITRGGPSCNEDRYCTYRGWDCRNVGRREIDSRCVRGGRVIRFQYS